ncbi:uncharacterized protein LOC120936088 [Rana temporaria]|uniref:uncharacterized protein LOC120936088 n=1 Tax=Rana temporaria TaxID=8407 RepID=UPI001AADEA92|nr:uncharacterized protein LOC120936088 [Rana temporaria]
MARHVLLCLLCLLTCIPGGMLLTNEELARVTEYIKKEMTDGHLNFQHAYAVKFTLGECRRLSPEVIKQALSQEDIESLRDTVYKFGVYNGPRMVAASYSDSQVSQPTLHAEYRLLHGEGNVSPIQNLMNKAPEAGCVVFFSLYSPCLSRCVNIENDFNIIKELSVFDNVNEAQRAFVFRNIYSDDKKRPDNEIVDGWRSLNERMTLFNCKNGNCDRCFIRPVGGKESLVVRKCLHP